MATSTQAKAAALAGLDFIETEEDVKAVEAATLKIQSTFRGKKFGRAKVGAGAAAEPQQPSEASPSAQTAPAAASKQVNKSADQPEQQSDLQQASSRCQSQTQEAAETKELRQRVAKMQVQDNSGQPPQMPEEEEAERAATKIQAGFKGYKTRKELEEGGKLPASSASSRQAAPGHNK